MGVTDFLKENLLFGYELVKKDDPQKTQQEAPSFVQKENDDGAVVVAASGGYGTYVDLDGSVRTEAELITKYREMVLNAEIRKAVDEIVNEIVEVEEEETVKIKLDDVNASDQVKDALEESFDDILTLLNFNNQAYNIMRRWYVDGRLYYHIVINLTQPKNGIHELRYVDPRKIRKIREVIKRPITQGVASTGGVDAAVTEVRNEYYMYNDRGFGALTAANQPQTSTTGIKIAEDSIALITSGLTDPNGTMVLSFLHFAIKALNQLRAIEDASVIYRLARAPERRVWYIDVGTLPKVKAEQYVASIMNKHKNRLTYDASTGEYRDDRKFMTMLEDYWLPRREGGKGTQVETLPGGDNLGEMTDVEYFQKKLFGALNVPLGRLSSEDQQSLFGGGNEITREEISFGKFVARLRNQFGVLFTKLLERHVVLKQIMSVEEFQRLAPKIKYEFAHDNSYLEKMENEVHIGRMDVLQAVSQWVGRYVSNDWVNKNIFRFTEEEVEEQKQKIEEEKLDPIYSQPMPGSMDDGMMGGMDGMGPEEMGMDDMMGDEGGDPNAYEGGSNAQVPGGGPQPGQAPQKPSDQVAQRKKTQQTRDPKRKSRPK